MVGGMWTRQTRRTMTVVLSSGAGLGRPSLGSFCVDISGDGFLGGAGVWGVVGNVWNSFQSFDFCHKTENPCCNMLQGHNAPTHYNAFHTSSTLQHSLVL